MGFSPNPMMGEPVRISFVGTPSSTSSNAISIFMADGTARTLQSFERLVIDAVVADVSAGSVDVLNAAAGAAAATAANLLGSFNPAMGLWSDGKEGLPCLVGVTPSLLGSNGTNVVKLSGEARIVEGTTQGVRPAWRESLTRANG